MVVAASQNRYITKNVLIPLQGRMLESFAHREQPRILQQAQSHSHNISLEDLLFGIAGCDAEALEELSSAIDERRFSLGVGKFCQACIYLVRALDTGVVAYVGSTTRSLKARWAGHESFFKVSPHSKWSAYVLEHGGAGNFKMELVEDYPCRSLHELLEREKYFINVLDPVCNVAMRTEVSGTHLIDLDDITLDEEESVQKFIRPLSSFRDDCRPYEKLPEITLETCKAILDNNKARKSNELEVLTAYKHIFDHQLDLAESIFEVRKEVFDQVMRTKYYRRIFVNVLLWRDKNRIDQLEELYGSQNPFGPSFEDVDGVLDGINRLVKELNFESPWDFQTAFRSPMLGDKLTVLQPIVNKLVKLMRLSASKAKKPITALSSNLQQICEGFADCKLQKKRTVFRVNTLTLDTYYTFRLVPCSPHLKILSIVSGLNST